MGSDDKNHAAPAWLMRYPVAEYSDANLLAGERKTAETLPVFDASAE